MNEEAIKITRTKGKNVVSDKNSFIELVTRCNVHPCSVLPIEKGPNVSHSTLLPALVDDVSLEHVEEKFPGCLVVSDRSFTSAVESGHGEMGSIDSKAKTREGDTGRGGSYTGPWWKETRAVTRNLMRKGLYVTEGGKFGFDMLTYPLPVACCHSTNAVSVVSFEGKLSPSLIIGMMRVANSSRKVATLSYLDEEGEPKYLCFQWDGKYS